MTTRIYEGARESGPLPVDPIDRDEVQVLGFDWGGWLADISASALDESTFTVSSRLVLGDGVVSVTKAGYLVTPPAPTISVDGVTGAHVYTAPDARDGDEVLVTNAVRAGQRVAQRSVRLRVVSR